MNSLGSMAQWDNQIWFKACFKASKPEVPGSTPDSSCFYLVFIKNLINDKSKHKNKNVTICFVLSGAPHSYL